MPDGETLPVVHDTGSGPALLLLHAFPLDASQWDHQVAALSGDFRCLRPDMWGCGDSPPPVDPLRVTLDGFAASVVAWLDAAGIGDVVLVGSSMGGYTAYAMLRQAPSRVRGLVLASARASADTEAQAADRRRMAGRALREGAEFIVEPMAARLLGPGARSEPHIADPVMGRIRRCRPEGIAACQIAMASRPDSGDLLASLTMPALVVAGEHDAVVSRDEAEALAAALPAGELAVLSGVGHLANLEDPPAFTDVLSEFLRRVAG